MKKRNKKVLVISIIVILCLIIALPTIGIIKKQKYSEPENFTWEEYQNMTPKEKAMFPDYFENMDEFYKWYDDIKKENEEGNVDSIDLGDKNPEDFTWEDFQKLTVEEKMVFPDYFESMDEFYKWYENTAPSNDSEEQ